MKDIDYLSKKRDSLWTLRQVWNTQFQILSQYVYTRKQGFDSKIQDGAFLNDGAINDSTAIRALTAMASAIMGALWKSGGKTFRLRRPKHITDNKTNQEYYLEINRRTAKYMESEKAGFELAFHETICEEGGFGTGGLGTFEGDYSTPLIYKSWSLQSMCIAETKDEFVDTIYYDEDLTVEQVVNRYGLKNVSESTAKKYEKPDARMEKVTVCVAIEPRTEEEKKGQKGNLSMAFSSCHFEVEAKHLLKESGFTELPTKVSRWYKLASEVYGRSPAMDALPAIMQLNALKEAFLVGVEKKVEPPLYVLDDGALGAATVDTSAGGLSVFNMSGRMNVQIPVGVIFDVGELQSVNQAITDTKLEVLEHFLIDKLYDLNNKTRMTLGEAQIRYDIRADALSSVFSRIINEQLTPTIERSMNILFEMGLLGVAENDVSKIQQLKANGEDPLIIPPEIVDAILASKEFYEIEYISPAARTLREAERRGVIDTVNMAIQLAQVDPDVLEDLDTNDTLEAFRDLSGAPPIILRSKEEAEGRKQAKAQARAEAAQAEQTKADAAAAQNIAQAQATLANAGQGGQG